MRRACELGGLALALALALACTGAPKDTDDTAETALYACDREPALSWSNFGAGYVGNHCSGCHGSLLPPGHREGAPAAVNLETYADVLTWADRFYARTTGASPTMPPGGGPTDDERALLDEWLICGVFPDVERWSAESGSEEE